MSPERQAAAFDQPGLSFSTAARPPATPTMNAAASSTSTSAAAKLLSQPCQRGIPSPADRANQSRGFSLSSSTAVHALAAALVL